MSDTAAFLAGCAVTGVAVLFVMRSNGAAGDPKTASSWQSPSPTPTMQSTPLPVPLSPNSDRDDGIGYRLENKLDRQQDLSRDLSDQLQRQQDRTEDMRTLLAQQQQETQNLKNELMRQQKNTEVLISQLQDQQRLLDRIADQPTQHSIQPIPIDTSANLNASNTARIQTFIAGALGVAIVVVVAGGGLVLFAIIIVVLLSSRGRQPRTVHIVHPFPPPYPAFPPQRMLPPRVRPRPTQPVDVEYYDDYDS